MNVFKVDDKVIEMHEDFKKGNTNKKWWIARIDDSRTTVIPVEIPEKGSGDEDLEGVLDDFVNRMRAEVEGSSANKHMCAYGMVKKPTKNDRDQLVLVFLYNDDADAQNKLLYNVWAKELQGCLFGVNVVVECKFPAELRGLLR